MRLSSLNKALLCKQNQHLAMEREVFQRQIVCGKYREVGRGWSSKKVRCVLVWAMEGYKEIGGIVNSRVSFSMGHGMRVKFQKDIWCGDEPLSVPFPSLFAIASSKEPWVVDLWIQSGERGIWTPRFYRHLNDQEIGVVEHFPFRLQDKVVNEEGEDKIIWLETKNGTFSIKPLYPFQSLGEQCIFQQGLFGMHGLHLKQVFLLGKHLGEKL